MMMRRSSRPWPLVLGLLCPQHTLSHSVSHIHTHSLLAAWGETCCNLGGREQRASLMQLARAFDVEPSHSLLSLIQDTFANKKKKSKSCHLFKALSADSDQSTQTEPQTCSSLVVRKQTLTVLLTSCSTAQLDLRL